MIKKVVAATLLFSVLFVTNTFAHIMSSDNVFTDISYSEAKEDIVLLSALGIISYQYEEYVFRPQDPLSKQELASWIGSYFRLEGETSEQLADAALKAGYLSSLIGMATYADINQAFFQNQLTLEKPEDTMTREQFVQFVVANANTEMNGKSLYELSGFAVGPVGTIEAVQQVEKLTAEGKTKKVYELTIDGEEYELGLHPHIAAQITDPAVWVGMSVTQSWIGPNVNTDATGVQTHDDGQESHSHSHHDDNNQSNLESENKISEFALQYIHLGSNNSDYKDVTNEVSNSASAPEKPEKNSTIETWVVITAIIPILAVVLIIFIYKRKKTN